MSNYAQINIFTLLFIGLLTLLCFPSYASNVALNDIQNLTLDTNTAHFSQLISIELIGYGLILFGFGCLFAEMFTPTYGVFSVTGLMIFILGILILFNSSAAYYPVIWTLIVLFIITFVGGLIVASLILRAHKKDPMHGTQALIGSEGIILNSLEKGAGQALIHGEIWEVRSTSPIQAQKTIRVIGADGLTLLVEEIKPLSES